MWVIGGVLLVAILIIIYEVPPHLKKKQKKEVWVFSLLLLCGIGLSIALNLDLYIPNPFDLIVTIFKPLSNFVMGLLK